MRWTSGKAGSRAEQPAGAGETAPQPKQRRQPTHRAVATVRVDGIDLELEIGAAWTFAAKSATGLSVVLNEVPPAGIFTLIATTAEPGSFRTVQSQTPTGNMPHLRAAVRNAATGRYEFIGDAWRLITDKRTALIHVRLKPGIKTLRFALFDRPVWTP